MPAFDYLARDERGASLSGTLEAASMEVLMGELRGRGLLVVDIQPAAVPASRSVAWLLPSAWLPMKSFDVEVGFQQLATMLHSGLSLLAGLRIVAEQARRPRAARVWRDLAERIEEGSTFSDALTAHRRIFINHVVQLIRVGEHAGTLEISLTRCAEHLERSRALKMMVLNALTYPLIVVLMAVGVAAFMLIDVIPKIQKFLNGRRLPAITQSLVDVSNFVMKGLPWFGLGFVTLGLAFYFIRRWPPGRLFLDGLSLRIPIVGGILRLSGTAVFARSMSILLDSGVTLLDSLGSVENLMGNRALAERVDLARQSVLRGGSLAGGLGGHRGFLPMLVSMVTVGESSGTLAPVLSEVARFHESQLTITIRRMSVMVEPVLILVVGGIVGFVYIAFFISIFSIASGGR